MVRRPPVTRRPPPVTRCPPPGRGAEPPPPLASGRIIHGDNLDVMRRLPDASIDLIYADPPFFTNRVQGLNGAGRRGPPRSHVFDDRWAGGRAAYLAWLAPRLAEMRRLLRDTGTLYVHCDWHAGHYIKVELDRIFGEAGFRNEIIWHYGLGAANARTHFLRKHDTILVYARGARPTFNVLRGDVTPAMAAKYCHDDGSGRYMLARGRRYYLRGGKPLDSVWEIPSIAATSGERLGYPTQKPEALLERIIRASSNEGDVVADFFAGSGTTGAVAQRLGRRWLLCDASAAAVRLMERRLGLRGP